MNKISFVKLWSRSISSWCILSIVVNMLSIYLIHIFYLPKALNWLVELSTLIFDDCVKLAIILIPFGKTETWIPLEMSALFLFLFQSGYPGTRTDWPCRMHPPPLVDIKLVACFVSDDHSRMIAFHSWIQKSSYHIISPLREKINKQYQCCWKRWVL